MVCKSFVLNNFIKKRLTNEPTDLRYVFFKGQVSKPHSQTGIHLLLTNCNTTSSDANLLILLTNTIYGTFIIIKIIFLKA